MKRILTLTAVAAMVFTACSKEESTGTGDKQVRITPTIANPALTPASMSSGTRATDTDFELNDKVGLTMDLALTEWDSADQRDEFLATLTAPKGA